MKDEEFMLIRIAEKRRVSVRSEGCSATGHEKTLRKPERMLTKIQFDRRLDRKRTKNTKSERENVRLGPALITKVNQSP